MSENDLTFWQHLDVLRGSLIRCLVAVAVCTVAAFCLKEPLFRLILWPQQPDFPTYRLLRLISADTIPSIQLINTGLAGQFIVHMRAALAVGALVVSPYILFELFRFISPALYPAERRASYPALVMALVLFFLGVALTYLVIFPFAFRFLGTYQVQEEVQNLISLESYLSTLLILCLMLGILFELPVLSWLLGRLGLLTSAPMRHYRRHAVVLIMIISAVITPTGDIFTLLLVSIPIWLLYEASILVVRTTEKSPAA